MGAHLAEPADTSALRGPKKRAKTDRLDSRHLRQLLLSDALPESWIPPRQVLEACARVRLHKSLIDQRTAWCQRIHAQLFHQGAAPQPALLTREARAQLQTVQPSEAGATLIGVATRMIDAIRRRGRTAARRHRVFLSPSARLPSPVGTLRCRAGHRRRHLGGARRLSAIPVI